MARIKKKGTSGAAKSYITRTQAVRRLQISLADFRQLCIFKGIYPREPRNKKKANKSATHSTTFYYTKDIQYLLHEPLLQKFRDRKSLAKKIGRALGRNEAADAARLERNLKPRITLDHIIKERYPTFVDALRDLDDCLSMLFLFANLPSHFAVPSKTIARCQRLCLEFQHYLIVTNSLRKSFLSIKGIYYQATIQGQDILWLVPYKFVQNVPEAVDFRIMSTFVEFYMTLLGFVNFRLYTSVNLVYPPKYDPTSDDKGGELGAFTVRNQPIGGDLAEESAKKPIEYSVAATERAQAVADAIAKSMKDSESAGSGDVAVNGATEQEEDAYDGLSDAESRNGTVIDTFPTPLPGGDILPQPSMGSAGAATFFRPFTFYLSRETPRQPLEFLLKAFGCKRVGWDAILGDGAFTTDELDGRITHQIVDRPPVLQTQDQDEEGNANRTAIERPPPRGRVPGRTYVQPQWIWDCINEGKLLGPDLYAPGATLPPHLSPWVKPSKREYDPNAPPAAGNEEDATGEESREDDDDAVDWSEESEAGDDTADGAAIRDEAEEESEDDDDDEAVDWSAESEASEDEVAEKPSAGTNTNDLDNSGSDNVQDEDSNDEYDVDPQEQYELECEAAGIRPDPLKFAQQKRMKEQRKARRAVQEKQDHLDRQKMMMSRRKRKLYEKMQYGNDLKEEEKKRLETKRQRIEREGR